MFETYTVDELHKMYPTIPRETISKIFLNGFNTRSAIYNDKILDLFRRLGPKDSKKYKEEIMSLFYSSGNLSTNDIPNGQLR